MGVLKARVSGAWVDVGLGGGPLNPGGVLGDILVKQSATDSDAVWTTQMPKLHVTSTTVATMDTVNPALTIGALAGSNVAHYQTGMQARVNGLIGSLNINPYGGAVIIGALDALSDPSGFTISESSHATSNRAALLLGSGWKIGQDYNMTGTKDFFIHSYALGQRVFAASADGQRVEVGDTSNIVKLAKGSGGRVLIGDDCELRDINTVHALGIVSQTDANQAQLYFGASSEYRISGGASGGFMNVHSASNVYIDGNTIYFRNAGYGNQGNISGGNLSMAGNVSANKVYTNDWFRAYGAGGLYFESNAVGIQSPGSGWMQTYGGHFALGDMLLRIRQWNDGSHYLIYGSEVPTGSGEASNGPRLAGYSSVWLYTTAYNKGLYISSAGNCFLYAGQTYNTFSSRESKENIVPLNPDECLDHVLRWRPVEFDLKEPPYQHAEGFISEDHALITPAMCNICDENSLRPGWANAVAYEQGTVRLTGAIQAIVKRLEQLEKAA